MNHPVIFNQAVIISARVRLDVYSLIRVLECDIAESDISDAII